MSEQNRRIFLQNAAVMVAGSVGAVAAPAESDAALRLAEPQSGHASAPRLAADEGKAPLRLGLILGVGSDPDAALRKVRDLGLPTCQVYVEEMPADGATRLRQALDKYGLEATSLVVGGPGQEIWDLYRGPLTIGLVPRETRAARIAHIQKA